MPRLAYTLALTLLLPFIALRLAWRGRKQPEYLRHLGERFGSYRDPTSKRPLIWLHAVSVGETRAAQPLVRQLRERYPGHDLLLTHMTPTGRATSEELFGAQVLRAYLPYDYPWAVDGFLRHFRPRIGLVMETEIWPNLVAGCRRTSVPLLLVNARLSEKSARGYGRLPRLSREAFAGLSAVAAQTEDDAERLRRLGARDPQVLGNMKFDLQPPAAQLDAGRSLRAHIGTRPVLLCASTRDGEEALILDALPAQGLGDTLVLIVPRHPQRFDAVARLVAERRLALQRRSQGGPVAAATRVLLGDTMGEMFAYYAACDVAFIGGSLLPLGGQNLIEACAVGKPVLVGPHTFNFAEAAQQAIAAGAALRVRDEVDLWEAVLRLLGDMQKQERMGKAGRSFAARHRGATRRTMDLIGHWLEPQAGSPRGA
jgi:3-deoxy-D-manno-octulosonic-acid transferase